MVVEYKDPWSPYEGLKSVDLKFPDWTPMFLMTETDYDPMLGILKVFVYDLNGYYVGEFFFHNMVFSHALLRRWAVEVITGVRFNNFWMTDFNSKNLGPLLEDRGTVWSLR